jgi:hypothetical protein
MPSNIAIPPPGGQSIRRINVYAVYPFERVQLDGGCARPWIGRRFHKQSAVVELSGALLQQKPGFRAGVQALIEDGGIYKEAE